MTEIIGAVLGLALLVVQYFLRKEKTKSSMAEAASRSAEKKMIGLKKKIVEGKVYDIKEDLDSLDRDIRMLLRVYKKTRHKR